MYGQQYLDENISFSLNYRDNEEEIDGIMSNTSSAFPSPILPRASSHSSLPNISSPSSLPRSGSCSSLNSLCSYQKSDSSLTPSSSVEDLMKNLVSLDFFSDTTTTYKKNVNLLPVINDDDLPLPNIDDKDMYSTINDFNNPSFPILNLESESRKVIPLADDNNKSFSLPINIKVEPREEIPLAVNNYQNITNTQSNITQSIIANQKKIDEKTNQKPIKTNRPNNNIKSSNKRKRISRNEMTQNELEEMRAANRLAAQRSRDKKNKKIQYLENQNLQLQKKLQILKNALAGTGRMSTATIESLI